MRKIMTGKFIERRKSYSEAALTILSTISRSSLDALIAIDGEGMILEFGPTAEEMYGYSRDEALGQPVHDVVIPERLHQAHIDGMKNYFKTGEGPVLNTRVEVPSVRRDGTEFEAELTVVPLKLDGKQLFMAFVRDISERKRYEEELKKARDLAEQASEAKSRFLAHMSHEIRSPLNAVLAAVELLENAPLQEEERKFARTAGNSGRVLLNLVNHILDFSRIEAGEQELKSETVELRPLLTQTLEIARPRAQGRRNLLLACVDRDVPKSVQADGGVLRQILTNLVDNANKFTEDGVVGVTFSCPEGDPARLRIEVADTGVGIPAEKLDSLFEEFVQADQSHATLFDGTGLGLAIVRRLAERMGGRVWAESEPGTGSRFFVEVPVEGAVASDTGGSERIRAVAVTREPLLVEMLEHQVGVRGGALRACAPQEIAGLEQHAFDLVLVDEQAVSPGDAGAVGRLRAMSRNAPLRWLLRGEGGDADLTEAERDAAQCTLVLCTQMIEGEPEGASADAPAAAPGPALAGVRLMLAEDSMANQLVATAILEKAGAEVHVVNNGQEAVEQIAAIDPDLVLMDLRMPEKDGIAATREIRAMEGPVGQVLILALTANAVQAEIRRCLDSGMHDYITKPIEGALLVGKVAEWIERGRREGTA